MCRTGPLPKKWGQVIPHGWDGSVNYPGVEWGRVIPYGGICRLTTQGRNGPGALPRVVALIGPPTQLYKLTQRILGIAWCRHINHADRGHALRTMSATTQT